MGAHRWERLTWSAQLSWQSFTPEQPQDLQALRKARAVSIEPRALPKPKCIAIVARMNLPRGAFPSRAPTLKNLVEVNSDASHLSKQGKPSLLSSRWLRSPENDSLIHCVMASVPLMSHLAQDRMSAFFHERKAAALFGGIGFPNACVGESTHL